MNCTITVFNLNPNTRDSATDFVIQLPNKCPRCSTAYSSKPDYACFFHNNLGAADLYTTFFCPACEKAFFVTYSIIDYFSNECGYIVNQYPFPTEYTKVSDKISNLSPKFAEIFYQAEVAENSGLTELCGIGYRKALEFLVKDYAISMHPESKKDIESCLLGKCINHYISNEKIKTLAKASAWLGNDETHYVRKHEDYNLQNLKQFIFATVAFVECELSLAEAEILLSNPQ